MVAELPRLNLPAGLPEGTRLGSRIGIHSGLVVVDEYAGQQRLRTITGETPNIAARLQQQAEPDTVAISGATRRLVEGLFILKDLGARTLKGTSSSTRVYQVMGQTGAESKFDVAVQTGLLPLVGREQELKAIFNQWEATKAGLGRLFLLEGEPGIGKSRLVMEVEQRIQREGATVMEMRCSPYNQNTAFHPLIRLLEVIFGLEKEDRVETKLAKISRALAGFRFVTDETPQLIGALLSLSGVVPVDPNPKIQKEQTARALLSWMTEQAERAPICFVLEDLHWADASTLEYLAMLASALPGTPLLALMTMRPEFNLPQWGTSENAIRLILTRLGTKDVESISQLVAGEKTLPPEVIRLIVRQTDGIPLFAEELTRMVLESELLKPEGGTYKFAKPLRALAIPSTLQDSLMARLDRLGSAKEVAQLSAVLGREFSYDVLSAVSNLDDEDLRRCLVQLTDSGLIWRHKDAPEAKYLFKHALVRDAAYDSLLRSARQKYHARVARILEERYRETLESQPEILARHLTESNQPARAIAYWLRAGEHAAGHSANLEAIRHFSDGLALLEQIPQDSNRDRLEFELNLGYLSVLILVEGWAAPQARTAYARAQELGEILGEESRMSSVYYGLSLFNIASAQHRTAHDYARRVLEIAKARSQPESLLVGNWIVGSTLYFLGRPKESYEHLVEALKYEGAWQEAMLLYGQHPQIECMCFQAQCLWPLGFPDSALRKMEETTKLAAQSQITFNLAYSSCCMLLTLLARRDYDSAVHAADALICLCTEHNFEYFRRVGALLRGVSLIFLGKTDNIDELRDSLTDIVGPGVQSFMYKPYFQTNLADCYRLLDRSETGLTLIQEALDCIEETGERWWEPEGWRVKGDALLSLAKNEPSGTKRTRLQSQAEQAFHRAISAARSQNAKSHELRATTSLSGFLAATNNRDRAKHILFEVYNWFIEGFDTLDLSEARELLERV
jgi:predicted ATPase